MSIFRPLLESVKSLSKVTKNYYSAWSTLGRTFKLKAEAELLDAVIKKMKIDEEYSQLSDKEVEQAKEVMDALSDKLKNERHQIIFLSIPLICKLQTNHLIDNSKCSRFAYSIYKMRWVKQEDAFREQRSLF